jgi:hypothetical protein
MSISASRRNLSSSFLSHVTRFYVRAVLARSVLMVWRSASVGGVRVKQPIGRALSMGLSESEDGSAATGQMVMRSFTSFLFYVRSPQKKTVFSSCSVRLALHVHRRKLCRFWLFRVGPYNYVPAVLKLPTSSPPHGIGLEPPGGLRPISLSLIYQAP